MGSDSWGLVLSAVVTGVFGVVLILMQRNTHNEIKSPNGTKTGDTLYEMKIKQGVIAEIVNNLDTRVGRLEINEALAHQADADDRALKAEETKVRQQEIVAAVKETPNVVVVSPVASEAERKGLS